MLCIHNVQLCSDLLHYFTICYITFTYTLHNITLDRYIDRYVLRKVIVIDHICTHHNICSVTLLEISTREQNI